jgi:DNA-binding beta-propeller fold protein YncE
MNRSLTALVLLATATTAGASDRLPGVTVSWLGNSFPGASSWVQQDVRAMAVTPDGTVYTNVEWDEAGREVGLYRDGKVVGRAEHTHGWGYHGGRAIALDDQHVYIAQGVDNEGGGLKDADTWPPKGAKWIGVSRRLRSDITRPAPFPGGKGGKGDTLKGALRVVAEVPSSNTGQVVGLAVSNGRVFVAESARGSLLSYDAATMTLLQEVSLDRVGPIAIDSRGTIWMVLSATATTPPRVDRFTPDLKIQPGGIELPADVEPTALALDRDGKRLFIADAGKAQNVRIYENLDATPRLARTFGVEGGVLAGPVPGAVGPGRLNHPSALGLDAAGNLYVASDGQTGGGGNVLESYDAKLDGTMRWRLEGLTFVDLADTDPGSEQDVFTKEEHFRIDSDSKPGQPAARYAAYTVDRFRFPDDPRLRIWSAGAWVRRIDGKPFLFVNDMNAEHLQIHRFAPGSEIAIPCGMIAKRHVRPEKGGAWPPHQPEKGAWTWRDDNGDGQFNADEYAPIAPRGADLPPSQGWWVDDNADIWLATEKQGIRLFARDREHASAGGVPAWSASPRVFPAPSGFREIKRLRYDPATDTMFLGGTTDEHANQHWKPMGPVIAWFDGWMTKGPTLAWKIVAPYAKGSRGHESCEPMGFDVAGDFLFVPYTGASKDTGFATGHVEVFRRDTGQPVGWMEPSEEIGEVGLQDVRECLSARRLADGSYRVFVEDDFKSKVLMYQWRPRSDVTRR